MERVELYRCRPPEGLQVPLLVRQSNIEDGMPTEAEVAEAVRVLKGGRAGGLSGMHTNESKGWLQEATRKKEPVRRWWDLLVRLVQRTLGYGTPPAELAWETIFLISKGKGEYPYIGIFEVALNVCAVVVNCQLKRGVSLHNDLHSFREGRGMGTVTLDAKLDQYLAGLAQKPLSQVFLDTCMIYYSLDRGLCLEVLRSYGMGPNLACLLNSYWDHQRIVLKTGKFLGKEFLTGRGVTQGDPVPPHDL